MSNEVNSKLYDFLLKNETGLYQDKENVIPFVHIDFCDLAEFVEIVGSYHFDEGGTDVQMFENTVCIDLDYIIESEGHYLSDYKSCFKAHTWKLYAEQIEVMERKDGNI